MAACLFSVSASKTDQYSAAQKLIIGQDAKIEWERISVKMTSGLKDDILRYEQRVKACNIPVKKRQTGEPAQAERAGAD